MTQTKTVQGHFISYWSPSHYAYVTNDEKVEGGNGVWGVYVDIAEYPSLMNTAELEICGSRYFIDDWYLRVHGKYMDETNLMIPDKIVLLGETENEIAELEKVPIREDVPKSAVEYFELAMKSYYNEKLHHEDRILEGIRYVNYAIETDPENANAWLLKGRILKDAQFPNNMKNALRCFEEVIKLNPVYENALMEYIVAHYWLGTLDKHIDICDRLLDINPNNYEAWYWKGVVLLGEREYGKAIVALDKAIKNNSSFIDAWMEKGYVLALVGEFQEALQCLDVAEKMISPTDDISRTVLWDFRAKVYSHGINYCLS